MRLIESEVKVGGCLAPTEGAKKLSVFEFNSKTAPTQRHRLIQQFQVITRERGHTSPRDGLAPFPFMAGRALASASMAG